MKLSQGSNIVTTLDNGVYIYAKKCYTVDGVIFALQKFHVKNLHVKKISNIRCMYEIY